MKKFIILIIIVVVCAAYYIISDAIKTGNEVVDMLNKTATYKEIPTLVIGEDEKVDADYLARVYFYGENDSDNKFPDLDDSVIEELIDYLRENGFMIKPGKYYIYRSMDINEIVTNLSFKKVEKE